MFYDHLSGNLVKRNPILLIHYTHLLSAIEIVLEWIPGTDMPMQTHTAVRNQVTEGTKNNYHMA